MGIEYDMTEQERINRMNALDALIAKMQATMDENELQVSVEFCQASREWAELYLLGRNKHNGD